jgi:hypothetical protein
LKDSFSLETFFLFLLETKKNNLSIRNEKERMVGSYLDWGSSPPSGFESGTNNRAVVDMGSMIRRSFALLGNPLAWSRLGCKDGRLSPAAV